MQAVILAAGKGLRLRPFTEHHPKPLIPVANIPLIERTISSLPDEITEIIIVVGYLGDQIISHIGSSYNDLPITYVEQTELLGTGDALLRAKHLLHKNFLVVNGDDLYTKEDLAKLISNNFGILAWESTQPAGVFGLATNEDYNLTGFSSESKLINCGAYALNCSFFDTELVSISVHGKTEYSLPHTLAEISETSVVGVTISSHWLPVGTPLQLDFANNYYIKSRSLKAQD
jgi:UDP-N-acetylglucosamine diphosphorylase / glucose-1-phosphate thymidylyltransferase / UDP-N-acetylgalactosamine diphosphorylase / glucosamine-1-phosphate N-acetyltransferase / galactosamine-1-phosphate N-acetyltransferase